MKQPGQASARGKDFNWNQLGHVSKQNQSKHTVGFGREAQSLQSPSGLPQSVSHFTVSRYNRQLKAEDSFIQRI